LGALGDLLVRASDLTRQAGLGGLAVWLGKLLDRVPLFNQRFRSVLGLLNSKENTGANLFNLAHFQKFVIFSQPNLLSAASQYRDESSKDLTLMLRVRLTC
jgi:hypothetical protein